MRVVLAIDGSSSSAKARDLVAGLSWPDGSTIRVVGAVEHGPELFGLPWMPVVPTNAGAIEEDVVNRLTDALLAAKREIARPTLTVDHVVLRGHIARAIVDEARTFDADLVVLGSRGHGGLGTMLLGSTSAEVVDHAPCPVLVVRDTRIGSIVLGEDGSTGARDAAACVEEWQILAAVPVTVVSVAEVAVPMANATLGLYDQVMESYTESVDLARAEHRSIALRRADRLARTGRAVQIEVREGDAAAEIVTAAGELKTDLVVIGTRGHTGLTRMILGSVARKVLTHAPCSVLVVREGVRPEPAAAVSVGSGAHAG
jgi:nucleotide-binding universal stress UspA family protein